MQQSNQNSNEHLIVQVKSGDKVALAQLVKRWHKPFCNKAFWLVKNKSVAKDIAQESWQVIIQKINDLKDPSQFKSWAFRIVSNKSLDHLRHKARERVKLQDYNIETEEWPIDNENLKEKQKRELLEAIQRLTINQQVVIRLFYLESYSLKEISLQLDISVGTVKSRLFHAREQLKIIIKEH